MTMFFVAAAAMLALSLAFVLQPLLRGSGAAPLRRHAGVLGVALPLLACALYAALGTPDALLPQSAQPPAAAIGPAQIEGMVQRLADRLKAQPDDADGWRRLARSYETLRRFEQAAEAYRHLNRLEPDNLDAQVDYAVVLGMTLGGKLAGPPEELLQGVLARDPVHLQALALAGSAALERGDRQAAVAHWKKILAAAPKDSPMYATVAENVARAEQQ